MSIGIMNNVMPFVNWEEREVGIDQIASEAAGRPVPRVVIMACISPHGSKDVVEKIAEDWLAQIRKKALNKEYPLEWSNFFAESFSEWKKGNELPRQGTPIKTWQMCTREAGKRLLASGITTVEDLSAFPDSNLGVIGMDGRYLRDLARGWINEAKDKGINTKALADANVKIDDMKTTIDRQAEQLNRLQARLEERETDEPRRGPGRPRKTEAA